MFSGNLYFSGSLKTLFPQTIPLFHQPFHRNRIRRFQLLREQRHAQFLQLPIKLRHIFRNHFPLHFQGIDFLLPHY